MKFNTSKYHLSDQGKSNLGKIITGVLVIAGIICLIPLFKGIRDVFAGIGSMGGVVKDVLGAPAKAVEIVKDSAKNSAAVNNMLKTDAFNREFWKTTRLATYNDSLEKIFKPLYDEYIKGVEKTSDEIYRYDYVDQFLRAKFKTKADISYFSWFIVQRASWYELFTGTPKTPRFIVDDLFHWNVGKVVVTENVDARKKKFAALYEWLEKLPKQ